VDPRPTPPVELEGDHMKVVGVGLNKTGTKTLGVCLRHWGFKHVSCDYAAFQMWRHGRLDELLASAKDYDTFEDWPWPLVYQDIDRAFPGTKFILTRRVDGERWFTSICKHALRKGPSKYRRHIYGHDVPHERRGEYIDFYDAHNRTVRDYFKGRPDQFLEVCWEEGSGWDALASFLALDRPDIPFPHANNSSLRA
jgi:hypothetical protein